MHPFTRASILNESLGMKMLRRSQEAGKRTANHSSINQGKSRLILNSRNNAFSNSVI